jgi:hypothetical protein
MISWPIGPKARTGEAVISSVPSMHSETPVRTLTVVLLAGFIISHETTKRICNMVPRRPAPGDRLNDRNRGQKGRKRVFARYLAARLPVSAKPGQAATPVIGDGHDPKSVVETRLRPELRSEMRHHHPRQQIAPGDRNLVVERIQSDGPLRSVSTS